ncbi:MAG: DUF6476 family protein [Sphingomonadales bacterium]
MPSEKTLKRIVIFLGVLLVAGFLVVVGTIIYRAMDLGEGKKPTDEAAVLTIPGDATPLGMSKENAVIILKVRNAEGEIEELVFDSLTGDYLGKLVRDD